MAGRRNRAGREADGTRKVSFEARVPDAAAYPLLDAVADVFGRVQRTLWADSRRTGRDPASFKREYLPRFGLTGRQFNSLRIDLDARVAAAKASQKRHLSTLGTMIENLKVRIAKGAKRLESTRRRERHHVHDEGTKRQDLTFRLHNLNRRLASLSDRRARVEADSAAGRVRLSFGGRRLFRHQFALSKSGFRSLAEWRQAWQRSRSGQFLCVGAGEETAGNQTCTLLPDGRLRLRLPDALAAQNGGSKYLLLEGIAFTRGSGKRKHAVPDIQAAIAVGAPVTYRFLRRQRKGRDAWYVQATVDVPAASVVTDARLGAIGVDINPAHVDAAEVDRCGNPLAARTIPIRVVGRSHEQAKASLCDASADLVAHAKATGRPLVIERPVFRDVKKELRYRSPRLARLLSSFAFDAFGQALRSRAAREGVEIIEVNPAFTSVIGYAKFGPGYGLSPHQGAAVAIARRGLGFGERLRSRTALSLPARNRGRHVWSDWSRQAQRLRAERTCGGTTGFAACGRRPSEGSRGGGIPPSRAAPARDMRRAEGPPGDGHAVAPGRDPPAQIVGNAVRPASLVGCLSSAGDKKR